MTIEVTQFLYPDGRQKVDTTEVSDDCATGYSAMREAGCRLTAEVLQDTAPLRQLDAGRIGHVSLCIEDADLGDYDHRLVPNGPQVQAALADMLRAFDLPKFRAWQADLEST